MAPEDALSVAPPIVTLTTDFGLRDAYVGVVKGVILSRAPSVRIVDLSHEVSPQNVLEAAFLLESAWRFFPALSVHLVVVDPGVGTARRLLALAVHGQLFVGPDNGCLSAALPSIARGERRAGAGYEARPLDLPNEVVAVSIENESLMLQPRSATFDGRDVFAPAVAQLALGGLIVDLGPRIESMLAFPAFVAPESGASLDGRVIHIDHFGNAITDIRAADVPASATFSIADKTVRFARTYAAAEGPTALAGSAGFIEIAVPNGSAAGALGVRLGEAVTALL